MKLPNYENAVVSLEKLRDYCLNEEHYRGKHKARVFKSTLDFEKTDENFPGSITCYIKRWAV